MRSAAPAAARVRRRRVRSLACVADGGVDCREAARTLMGSDADLETLVQHARPVPASDARKIGLLMGWEIKQAALCRLRPGNACRHPFWLGWYSGPSPIVCFHRAWCTHR